MFVLDTNVLSELRRPRPHGAVLAWIEAVELSALYIAAITVGEIQAGIERTRDNDKMKAFEIESWLEDILHRLPVLAMDAEIFRIWARLMHGRSSHLSEDAMIAATAMRHGLTIATRNTRHFAIFEAPVINPFEFR
jgi:predicted nucleic acid-binding protein